jgi:predicted porin
VKNAFVRAILLCSLFSSAQAADLGLGPVKDPLPDNLTWHGITLYGAIDIAGQYVTRGAPLPNSMYATPGIISPMGRTGMWLLAPNQEQVSFIGLKTEQPLGYDTTFLANAQIGFTPVTGALDDTPKTLQQQNGVPLAQQYFSGDGARAGTLFNGLLYAGLANPTYGTVIFGRQFNLLVDNYSAYDPLLSYGASYAGWAGTATGPGSPETPYWDQSVKYTFNYDPFHVSGMYGSPGTNLRSAWQLSGGFAYNNFSFDAVGGQAFSQVSLSALSAATITAYPLNSNDLGAKIFDSDVYAVFAKYKIDLDSAGHKDDSKWIPSLTFFGGYERLVMKNPSDGGVLPGHQTIGGYEVGPVIATNGSTASGIVNNGFTGGNETIDIFFGAMRYDFHPQWKIAAEYSHYQRSGWGFDLAKVNPSYSPTPCSNATFINCGGSLDIVSARIQYQWTKRIDVYFSVAYSSIHRGWRAGYLHTDDVNPTLGIRYVF